MDRIPINRRRAPSSLISSQKKLGGHHRERIYAKLIGGIVLLGTKKGDIKDINGKLHSVKSGKKWQVFLYGYGRISTGQHINILKPCLDAFPENYAQYLVDREKCIAYKELYVLNNGREAAKYLSNDDVAATLGANTYIEAKNKLEKATLSVRELLNDKDILRSFLDEAIFNNGEVAYLAIEDTISNKDRIFRVFSRDDVLNILSRRLYPAISTAGRVPEDFNVAGQKTLLRYEKVNGQHKNIVEIEIRNDSAIHYRQVRFNMYAKDALYLLLSELGPLSEKVINNYLMVHGKAITTLDTSHTSEDIESIL